MDKIEIPDNVKAVMYTLLDKGFDAYIVGGAIRDSLYHMKPKDYDLITNATGEQMLKLFKKAKVIGGEERQAKILTVVVDGIEISQYRANPDRTEVGLSLETHLSTCDFTFNAMYCGIDGIINDPYYGKGDIKEGRISCVGNTKDRMKEDRLRVMRAIRFMAKYGIESVHQPLENELWEAKIGKLPKERVKEELFKIMQYKRGIEYLEWFGIIYKIIPEFMELDIDGGHNHDETVLEHSIMAFENSCGLTDNILLRFACLIHDIGKPSAMYEEDGKVRFQKHSEVGQDVAEKIMKRLKFSDKEIKYVKCLVRVHMWGYQEEHKRSKYIKLFADLEDSGVDIMDLMVMIYSDSQANLKNDKMLFIERMRLSPIYEVYYKMKYEGTPFTVKDMMINGYDVMKLGVKPGKEVGEILNEVFEKVMEGSLPNVKSSLMGELRSIIDRDYVKVL